MLLLNHVIL
jgi:squalene cyclase